MHPLHNIQQLCVGCVGLIRDTELLHSENNPLREIVGHAIQFAPYSRIYLGI